MLAPAVIMMMIQTRHSSPRQHTSHDTRVQDVRRMSVPLESSKPLDACQCGMAHLGPNVLPVELAHLVDDPR
jgi:hypothetical protein